MTGAPTERSENVAFGAFSCAFMPLFREGGPVKWLINKDLQFHLLDFEPGGREFESLRARHLIFCGPDDALGLLLKIEPPTDKQAGFDDSAAQRRWRSPAGRAER